MAPQRGSPPTWPCGGAIHKPALTLVLYSREETDKLQKFAARNGEQANMERERTNRKDFYTFVTVIE